VTIENNLHYSEKQEYIELAKNFLANKITADNFSYSFMAIYEGISQRLCQMEKNESLELANFNIFFEKIVRYDGHFFRKKYLEKLCI